LDFKVYIIRPHKVIIANLNLTKLGAIRKFWAKQIHKIGPGISNNPRKIKRWRRRISMGPLQNKFEERCRWPIQRCCDRRATENNKYSVYFRCELVDTKNQTVKTNQIHIFTCTSFCNYVLVPFYGTVTSNFIRHEKLLVFRTTAESTIS
jgi:hypothetical protein